MCVLFLCFHVDSMDIIEPQTANMAAYVVCEHGSMFGVFDVRLRGNRYYFFYYYYFFFNVSGVWCCRSTAVGEL